jgi:hypothetical protein
MPRTEIRVERAEAFFERGRTRLGDILRPWSRGIHLTAQL